MSLHTGIQRSEETTGLNSTHLLDVLHANAARLIKSPEVSL